MSSTQITNIRPSFGDVVQLSGSRVGRVRFIGFTKLKSNTLLYGIHLKESTGKHNGTIHNTKYFKCPQNHGIFVSINNITKIIKKHTASNISFYYNQIVKVSNIGTGRIRFIGMTNFGNNYWFGVKLKNEISKIFTQNDDCIHYLKSNQINIYFNASYKNSIFVRSNRLQSVSNTPKNKKHLKLCRKSKSSNGEYKPTNDYNLTCNVNSTHVNETMLSMMNQLDIPKRSRGSLMGLKKEQKLLLIKQWFITPNHKRTHSDPTTPINNEQSVPLVYESKSIDMELDEYECFISNERKKNGKKIKRKVKKKVMVKSVKNNKDNRNKKKRTVIRRNNGHGKRSKSKPTLKLKNSSKRSKTMMPKSNKHKKKQKQKQKKKIVKSKKKKSGNDDSYMPKYKPIFKHNYSHSEEYYW